jgi:hypothetical protein
MLRKTVKVGGVSPQGDPHFLGEGGMVPASTVSWALREAGRMEGASSRCELDVEEGGESNGSRSGRRAKC